MEIVMDSVRYEDGRGFPILDDIQLTFTERKVYGIISTDEDDQTRLAQLLAGFFLPTAGEIHYGLETVKSYDQQVHHRPLFRKIGYVSKDGIGDFLYSTVYEELATPIHQYHYREQELEKRVLDALKMVALPSEYLYRDPFTLSRGEQKKLALAVALICNPAVLILEEPMLGLDRYEQNKLCVLLRKLKNRYHKTILIFSKQIDGVFSLLDEVVILHQHTVLLTGPKYQVFRDTRKLKKIGIPIPNLIAFSDMVLKKKHIKMGYRDQINDLIKDIYRYAEWGCGSHGNDQN